MIDSLNIGKIINYVIVNDATLSEIIDTKLYPVVAVLKNDESISSKLPFITYQRDGLNSSSTKDGIHEDSVSFNLKVYTSNYTQSVLIANRLREIFEGKKITYNSMYMTDTELDNAYEEYNDNYSAYIQILRFNTNIS